MELIGFGGADGKFMCRYSTAHQFHKTFSPNTPSKLLHTEPISPDFKTKY